MQRLMQWTYFLDVLGYGEEQKNIDTQEKANQFIEFMEDNKKMIDFQEKMDINSYSDKKFNIYDYYDFKSVFISDSFVLTAIPKDTLFNDEDYYNFSTFIVIELTFKILMLLEHILTEKGLLLRGGISNKFTDINTNSSLAVGQGLIEAYKLESNFAEVPRILLSQDISNDEKIMSHIEKHSQEHGRGFSIFCKDIHKDDFYYLDYLGFILSFMHKSEDDRLNIQKKWEHKYGINRDILQGLLDLLEEKNREDFQKKLLYIEQSLSKENILKINKMLNEPEKNFLEEREHVQKINNIKHTTIKTLETLQEVIYFNLKKHSENQKILKNYMWLREYLNNTIAKFKDIDSIQEYKVI